MDREAWRARVHGNCKESDTTEHGMVSAIEKALQRGIVTEDRLVWGDVLSATGKWGLYEAQVC